MTEAATQPGVPQHQVTPVCLGSRLFLLELRASLAFFTGNASGKGYSGQGERGGRAEIGVIEGDKEAASPELMKVLPGHPWPRSIIQPAVPDEVIDQQQKSNITLYQ